MKKLVFIILVLFITSEVFSQVHRGKIQTGIGIKLTIDITGESNFGEYTNFNASVIGGAGFHPFEFRYAYPSLHTGVAVYNRGELISSYREKGFFENIYADAFINLTLNTGYYRNNIDFSQRLVPIIHFSDLLPNPLQNPYQHSFSIGSNMVFSLFDQYREFQRVGIFNAMVDRHFQLNIYNDGSLWGKLCLGDGEDRYYTGGGSVSYHMDHSNFISQVFLSFHKFTGYEKDTFEAANLIQLDFIPYKKEESFYYNKNRWRLSLSNPHKNFGVHITLPNTDKDIQDGIHFNGNYTYHQDIFKNETGLRNEFRRMGMGGSFILWENNFN